MKLYLVAIAILPWLLIGCGSTSDNSNDAMDNNFTILKGTVPGTLIEAFCMDGSYYKSYSHHNDTPFHPFELEVPQLLHCHLVMTTNESNLTQKVVSPIRFISKETNSSIFYGVASSVDLGYIPLPMERSEVIDDNGDGVVDSLLQVEHNSSDIVLVNIENDPLDIDNDGIINVYEDYDHDGITNKDDEDDDNDGIIDDLDSDDNDDGIDDDDRDGDGVKDDDDIDDDNDGKKDENSESSKPGNSGSSQSSEASEEEESEDQESSSSESSKPGNSGSSQSSEASEEEESEDQESSSSESSEDDELDASESTSSESPLG